MKTCLTLMMAFLLMSSSTSQKKKDLYIIDFHNAKEYNSKLGKNIADEFSNSLELCKTRYRIVPREEYREQLQEKTFEECKRFLEKEGIDYVIYGDVFHDDDSKEFIIEYILEELETGAIFFIETINFRHISKLVNASKRQKIIDDKLKNDKNCCKRPTKRKKKS